MEPSNGSHVFQCQQVSDKGWNLLKVKSCKMVLEGEGMGVPVKFSVSVPLTSWETLMCGKEERRSWNTNSISQLELSFKLFNFNHFNYNRSWFLIFGRNTGQGNRSQFDSLSCHSIGRCKAAQRFLSSLHRLYSHCVVPCTDIFLIQCSCILTHLVSHTLTTFSARHMLMCSTCSQSNLVIQ